MKAVILPSPENSPNPGLQPTVLAPRKLAGAPPRVRLTPRITERIGRPSRRLAGEVKYTCGFEHEEALWASGEVPVAGVDEAGRGPLAGPVVVAAVILPRQQEVAGWGLNDSKQLNEEQRERLYQIITAAPEVIWAVAVIGAELIDQLNILRATHHGMAQALTKLRVAPKHALVDGLPVRGLPCEHTALVKGDARSRSIAAASILAKVTRDRLMCEAHTSYPHYGFAQHKGYPTPAHRQALAQHGPCPLHRRSFAPVAQQEFRFEGGGAA